MAKAHPIPTDHRFVNLTGRTFGFLVVESYAGKQLDAAYWNCRCECGCQKPIAGTSLKRGSSTNCGCKRTEKASAARRTHGMTKSPEFKSWTAMRNRCSDPSNPSYPRYGGAGVTVCERWSKSFANFFADMGRKPTARHQIERKDNSKPYEPGNCGCSPDAEQARNRRTTKFLTHAGLTLCLKDWATHLKLNRNTIPSRLKKGWPLARVLSSI
jgi:hypothetical protein